MRMAALIDAQERLVARIFGSRGIPVRLSLIDDAALLAWREQWTPRPDQPGGWNWPEQTRRLRSTLGRFEIALWSGPILCGLAIGKPSKGPSHLAVQLIEGNPAPTHPLKGFVAECVTEAAFSDGRLLNKSQPRLLRPLPGALEKYRAIGFGIEPDSPDPSYCFLEISRWHRSEQG
jgi:hypothetical protein